MNNNPIGFVFDSNQISNPKKLHGSPDIAPAIIEYKSFLLESIIKNPSYQKIAKNSYELINANTAINSPYALKEFAMEANELEKQFYELNKHIDVLPFYNDLLKRLENFSKINYQRLTNVGKKILYSLYTMIFSKIESINNGHSSDLITKVDRFIQSILTNLNELNEVGRIISINNLRDDYNDGIVKKMQEAFDFIETDITPQIEQKFVTLNIELHKTVDEINGLQLDTVQEIENKKENLRIIRRNILTRQILSIIEKASTFIGKICVPIIGKIAAGVVYVGSSRIRENIIDPKIHITELPSGIQNFQNKIKRNDQDRIEAIEMELNKLAITFQNINVTNQEFTDSLNALISKVDKINLIQSPIEYFKTIQSIQSALYKESIEFLNKWQQIFTNSSNVQMVPSIKRAKLALTLIGASVSVYHKYSDNDQIGQVEQAITNDYETLQTLNLFEQEILADFIPIVEELHIHLNDIENSLPNKSAVALDVLGSKIKMTLYSVQTKLNNELSQLDTAQGVNDCLVYINEAIALMIDLYNRIQNYYEDSERITYLSDLQLASFQDEPIIDRELDSIFNKLQQNLKINQILGQYFRAIDAFKMAIFPFAADYLDAYELTQSLTVDEDTSLLIDHAKNTLNSLSEKIMEYDTTSINENDQLIHDAYFDRYNGSTGPFYAWKNIDVRDKLQQLFNGSKIYLYADVKKSDARNAIKFKHIELIFRSAKNQSISDHLNGILQSFQVSLMHMGNSNYRCGNTFYTISSRPIYQEYSIAKRNGTPADRTRTNSKLNDDTALLSPYTLWSMQLTDGKFDQLQPFVELVDIELHGLGSFVTKKAAICNPNLDRYYEIKGNL